MEKPCTICKQVKPLEQFKPAKRMRLGLASECRACTHVMQKAYRDKNKIEINRKQREFRLKNSEVIKEKKRQDYLKHKDAYKKRAKMWAEKNSDRVSARYKIYKEKNKERLTAYSRQWSEQNKDHLAAYRLMTKEERRAYNRQYRVKNIDKMRANRSRRRAMRLLAMPNWVDPRDFDDIYRKRREVTELLGEEYHVDHIHPLKGENFCGLHVPYNLQLLPALDNIKKKNKLLDQT